VRVSVEWGGLVGVEVEVEVEVGWSLSRFESGRGT